MKAKSNIPEIKMPSFWDEKILFSCPDCGYENTIEFLKLELKFSDFHQTQMYFAECPDCGHEHIVMG